MASGADWVAVLDPSTNRTYYANMKTGAVQWEPPANWQGGDNPQVQYDPMGSSLNLGQSEASLYSSGPSMSNLNNQQASQMNFNNNNNKQQQSQMNMNKQPPSQINMNKQQGSQINMNKQQQGSQINMNKQQMPSQYNMQQQQQFAQSQSNFNKKPLPQQQQQQQQPPPVRKNMPPSNINMNGGPPPVPQNMSKSQISMQPLQQGPKSNINMNMNMNMNNNNNNNNMIAQSQQSLFQQQGGGQANPSKRGFLTPQEAASSKWKKAHDANSGKDYWYHTDTKETTWSMPPELDGQNGSNTAKRLSAQMAIMSMGQSVTQIQTAWQDSDEEDEHDDNESGDDNKENDKDSDNENNDKEEADDSDDGLEQYDPNKANIPTHTVVKEDDEVSNSEEDAKHADASNYFGNEEDEVIVQDTSDKYKEIGKAGGDKFKLEEYANIYFQKDKHKKGVFGKQSIQDLLKFAPYKKVQNALRKMDSKLNVQAKQTWKNINSYMGDRKSGKNDDGHIDKLLRFALKAPAELRDEIYLQICKQTNGNPRQNSLMKGWKLMAACCSIFPPSDEFACYLAVYLNSRTNDAGDVGKFALFALEALDRTMEAGQRRVQPLPLEIQRIENRESISIKVYFLDQSFRDVKIYSQTRAQQVCEAITKTLNLYHAESFGLFEMEEPKPNDERKLYEKRAQMERQQKIDDLQYMPYDRELELNERIMDIISSWSRSKKKQTRKIQLVYKCKLHSKAQETSYSTNSWKIAMLTAAWHVLHGYYPIDEEDAFKLAALQLQSKHGLQEKADFYNPGVVVDVIEKYIPWNYLTKYKPNDAENKILQYHKTYKHLDKQDAYRKYIEFVRKNDLSNKYFGNCFFRCVRVSRLKKQKIKEQEDLLLGISETGVVFVDPLTYEILERYKMEEILTYGFRSNAFLFVAGTLMTQKKYQFATMLGKQMNDLLRQHIDLRVQQAEVQGYQITQPQQSNNADD